MVLSVGQLDSVGQKCWTPISASFRANRRVLDMLDRFRDRTVSYASVQLSNTLEISAPSLGIRVGQWVSNTCPTVQRFWTPVHQSRLPGG